jgi:hypothetical protein
VAVAAADTNHSIVVHGQGQNKGREMWLAATTSTNDGGGGSKSQRDIPITPK